MEKEIEERELTVPDREVDSAALDSPLKKEIEERELTVPDREKEPAATFFVLTRYDTYCALHPGDKVYDYQTRALIVELDAKGELHYPKLEKNEEPAPTPPTEPQRPVVDPASTAATPHESLTSRVKALVFH
ncbi:MAG: hypothetical protein PHS57_04385 [Alphaproteobacteria bacterium]|nr:hypothetical protein [Alphaproteobacteria bacterium]